MPHNVIIYDRDRDRINQVLADFLEDSGARMALLVDRSGFILGKNGDFKNVDTLSLSALATGSIASTQALAKVVGEESFSAIFHQGKRSNIHISIIANFGVLVAIFDTNTTVAMVRLFARETEKKLEPILLDIAERGRKKS